MIVETMKNLLYCSIIKCSTFIYFLSNFCWLCHFYTPYKKPVEQIYLTLNCVLSIKIHWGLGIQIVRIPRPPAPLPLLINLIPRETNLLVIDSPYTEIPVYSILIVFARLACVIINLEAIPNSLGGFEVWTYLLLIFFQEFERSRIAIEKRLETLTEKDIRDRSKCYQEMEELIKKK